MTKQQWKSRIYFGDAIISFIGAFITLSDNLPTHPLIDKFSKWSHINDGLVNLQIIDSKLEDDKAGLLTSKETGFKEILEIIKKNETIPDGKVKSIAYLEPASIEYEKRSVPFLAPIIIDYYNHSPYLVTTISTLKEWIKTYRHQRILFWGFLLIAIGFLIDIIVKLIEIVENKYQKAKTEE